MNTLKFKLFLIFIISSLSSCDTLVSKYESYKRAHYNPYLNFQASIDCECENKDIISPQLRLIKKTDLYKNEKNIETILVTMESSSLNKNIYIKYDINQCGIISFHPNDIVTVKGRMDFESSNYIIEPVDGYIELNGQKYCVE